MALNIGELVAYLDVEDDGFDRKVDGAQGKISSLGSRITSTLARAAKAGAIALGGLGVAGGVMGIKTAAGMEQADIAFTTMLGSAQKAGAFLKDLQKFAAETPFEFPELQSAASSLISIGVNAKDVIPIMTTLGNVTSGMGTGSEGVQRATVAIQQMIAAQRISGEDLNQLRDAGIPVYDLLAKATGKSAAEVVKLAQAGKLGKKELDQMLEALKTGKGMERFAGLMEKQSQSLSGLWSTFMDTLNMGLANLLKPAIPLLKQTLGGLSGVFATGLAAVQGFFGAFTGQGSDALEKFSGPTMNRIIDAGSKAREIFDKIRDAAAVAGPKIVATLRDLASWIGEHVVPAVKDLGAFLVSDALPALKDLAGWVGDHVLPVVAALASFLTDKVIPAVTKTAHWFTEHKSAAVALAAAVGTLVAVTKVHAAVLAVQGAGGLVAYLKGIRLVQTATKTWAAVQWLLNAALTANPIGLAVVAIAALAAGIVLAWKHSETFRNVVTTAFVYLGKFLLTWAGIALDVVTLPLRGFLTIIAKIPGPFRGMAKEALKALDGIGGAIDSAKDKLDALTAKKVKIPLDAGELYRAEKSSAQLLKNMDTLAKSGSATIVASTGVQRRAHGGRAEKGQPYVVGDAGKPELFVPDQSGYVYPDVPGGGGTYIDKVIVQAMGGTFSTRQVLDDVAWQVA